MSRLDSNRQAILAIADGYLTEANACCLTDFVAGEIYGRLSPSAQRPGDLYQWLIQRGYNAQSLKAWLFSAGTREGVPTLIYGWAELITHIMTRADEKGCTCADLAHSSKARIAARKRCPCNHYLTRGALDAYTRSAPQRVSEQFRKQTSRGKNPRPEPTAEELQKAIDYHSDPLNFVRRAIHGNGPRLTTNEGARDFGHSMLAVVFDTPGGSQLRIKPHGRGYVLYDTRDGICGQWDWNYVACLTCNRIVTATDDLSCTHTLHWKTEQHDTPPDCTRSIDFAQCTVCSQDRVNRTMWLWDAIQRRCPVCDKKRRKRTIDVVVAD